MPLPPSHVIIIEIKEKKVSPSLAPDGLNTSIMGHKPESFKSFVKYRKPFQYCEEYRHTLLISQNTKKTLKK